MGTTEQIGLRDRRKPGHCYQDNELYEAFQPIIGGMAVLVYANATRHCYGTTARLSLREIADGAGISKDTVRRSLLAMQEVGMVRARGGSAGKASEYDLVDLKDLAVHLGAEYDRKRSSYVFPDAITAQLRAKVLQLQAELQGKTVSQRDSSKRGKSMETVSQRDSLFVEKDARGGERRDATVSPQAKTVSLQGQPYISNTQDIKTTSPLPLPASGKGEEAKLLREDAIEKAVDKVFLECSIADARLRKAMRGAVESYARRERMSPDEVAAAMIEAWREYEAVQDMLRYTWGARKFFLHGHWANLRGWPYDRERMERARETRVGVG